MTAEALATVVSGIIALLSLFGVKLAADPDRITAAIVTIIAIVSPLWLAYRVWTSKRIIASPPGVVVTPEEHADMTNKAGVLDKARALAAKGADMRVTADGHVRIVASASQAAPPSMSSLVRPSPSAGGSP